MSTSACAELVPTASNGQWATLGDTTSPVKTCAVQTNVNGGKFTLWGATDRQGVLRLSLYKSAWRIPDIAVPIVLAFSSGDKLTIAGTGRRSVIRADVPSDMVKSLLHHFTADDSATMTLPEGHEAPWTLDLHGTTQAIIAMAQCIDTSQLLLPPPFRPPAPTSVSSTFPRTSNTQAAAPPAPPAPPEVVAPAPSYVSPPTLSPEVPAQDSSANLQSTPAEHAGGSDATGAVLGVSAVFICIWVAGVALYFVPFLIGSSRKIQGQSLLFLVNLLFGWTIVGWFGCLLWGALAQDGVQRAVYQKLLEDQNSRRG